ncbi:glycoside hydrolase family 6 protein [Microbacterium sp. BK668]|uniref:glycoside hydrolase family 6 protein n=1 Tax=Microbacterium sp. BK668 TaxID=2512118 RepID=UPI00105E08AD|nr:glycoside hydrolase family 6 protein [Microbacterium sp. BK668]
MTSTSPRKRRLALGAAAVFACSLALPLSATGAAAAEPGLAGSDLFVNPFSTTLEAAQSLSGQARDDAQLLGSIPSAEWFTKGTPAEVEAAARAYVDAAAAAGQMPVLVAYNLPFRDCAQYSAGGALDTAAYTAWIDGLAAGIGDRPATVILEPDGLGIIPWYTTINGDEEWCKPAEADPATAAAARFEQLNHAVDALGALAATSVYLDGTHSGWLGVGDISDRLIKAGVERATGFFLNASNYVETERLIKYGTWISDCINLSVNSWWEPQWCASQYYPANPGDFSTWALTDAAFAQAYADTGVTRDPAAQAHFVLDTSRNGQGPWAGPVAPYPGAPAGADPEVWCNPPDRGLGALPTTETGNPLIDAYLWIKVPGESDGKCFRGTAGPLDPERGMEDPAAGQWFVEQARELIQFAQPPLAPLDCNVSWNAANAGKGSLVKLHIDGAATGPWTLSFVLPTDATVTKATHATVVQDGRKVSVTSSGSKRGNAPDVVLTTKGAADQPWIFWLDGRACTSA